MTRPADPVAIRYDGQQVQAGRDILGRDLDGFATSDELLRAGEPGLRFFEIFAPLYSRYTHTIVDYRSEITGPYRNLRGIDLAAFRHDAARFAGASAGLEESRHVLASSFRDLGSHWRGHAAEHAGNHVDRFLEQAGGVERDIGAFGRTAGRLGAAIAEQVRSRARVALELYSPECGGLPYPTVEDLVDIATGSAAARQILDTQFVPEFEARLAQFREVALAAVEDGIRRLWRGFSETTAAPLLAADPFHDLPLVMPGGADASGPSGDPSPPVPVPADEQASGTHAAGDGGPVSTRPTASGAGSQPGGATLGEGNAGQPGHGGATLGSAPEGAAPDRTGSEALPPMMGGASLGDDDRERSARRPLPPARRDEDWDLLDRLREVFDGERRNDRDG